MSKFIGDEDYFTDERIEYIIGKSFSHGAYWASKYLMNLVLQILNGEEMFKEWNLENNITERLKEFCSLEWMAIIPNPNDGESGEELIEKYKKNSKRMKTWLSKIEDGENNLFQQSND